MAETNYDTASGLSTSQAERGPRVSEEVRAKGEAGWGELLRRPVRVLRRRLASSLFLSFLVTQDLGGSWALAQLDAVLVSTPSQIRFGCTLARKAFSASEFNGRTARIIRLTAQQRWDQLPGDSRDPRPPATPNAPSTAPPVSWTRLASAGGLQAPSASPEQAAGRQLSARGSSARPLGPGSPPRLARSAPQIALPLPSTLAAVCLLGYGAYKQNAPALSCQPSPSHVRM